jgi:hypothetical protein
MLTNTAYPLINKDKIRLYFLSCQVFKSLFELKLRLSEATWIFHILKESHYVSLINYEIRDYFS